MEIDDLPAEVLVKVLGYVLDPAQLSRLAQVSRRWKSLAETDTLWRELLKRRWTRDEIEHMNKEAQDDGGNPSLVDWNQRWEAFHAAQKPPNASWKAFYLGHLRGPVERLLSELDRHPLDLAQLSTVTFRSKAASPPQEEAGDVWIRQLLDISRSARLQEALSAYPRACRDHLEVMRESVLTRLNFIRRARSMLFLGKLGLFAYLVKRFLPSLCPLPANFLTSRPTAGSLLRFWPLYVYCAAYYYAQKLLGRRGYMEGTPKWYLGVAKFGNHVLSSLLEEDQGSRLKYLGGVGMSLSLAYYALRFDLLLHTLSRVLMPIFHALTRNAYREVIARQAAAGTVNRHFHLFVVGLFAMNSMAHLVSRLASLKLARSSITTAQLTLTLRNLFPSLAASFSTTSGGGGTAATDATEASWSAQLWRLLDQRAVASQLLGLVNGNVVGWAMCHAAIHHGFPTVVALKLLCEAEVLLLHLATPTAIKRH
ncbi:Fbox domain containing protein [Acanthamoeba castellanii str. Neff]|uniref:Fbox domain containing protein n=1 Tax=Acanthamoeba castellanii (strain ATCC 30010 / Neff) TaxID=1257118 RepID=L8HE85_ACACF|nr:Fbox domain containing protein [Acanthamoeba castellanii str. Neff]ELR23063.1 Fbox domain containing protein [Acanthamoeba castellanii str. Neff]